MAVTITLRGRHYTVRSDEAEEDVIRLARWLDDRVAEMARRTPGVDGETVALLAGAMRLRRMSRARSPQRCRSKDHDDNTSPSG